MNPAKPAQMYAYEYSVTVNATIGDETRVMTKHGRVESLRFGQNEPIFKEVREWIACLTKAGFKVPPGPCLQMPAEVLIVSETKVKMPPSPAQIAAQLKRSSAGGFARAAAIRAAKAASPAPGSPATPV